MVRSQVLEHEDATDSCAYMTSSGWGLTLSGEPGPPAAGGQPGEERAECAEHGAAAA